MLQPIPLDWFSQKNPIRYSKKEIEILIAHGPNPEQVTESIGSNILPHSCFEIEYSMSNRIIYSK